MLIYYLNKEGKTKLNKNDVIRATTQKSDGCKLKGTGWIYCDT